MKKICCSVCLVLLMAGSLDHPVLAQPQSAGMWKLDRTASHEGLSSPIGMAYDAGGISLVSVGKTARMINPELGSPGPGIVAADADAAYVVDYGGTTVSRVDRQGVRTVIADGMRSPVGLAVAPDGGLMVAMWGANAAFQIRRR